MKLSPRSAFRGLFSDTVAKTLPASAHRQAWTLAVQTGDATLQKHLVRRLDAPADLLSIYATLTGPLRWEYLARPDTPVDELLAEAVAAKSADALERCVTASGWHPDVLERAAQMFRERPSSATAKALQSPPAGAVPSSLALDLLHFSGTSSWVLPQKSLATLAAALDASDVRTLRASKKAHLCSLALARHDVPAEQHEMSHLLTVLETPVAEQPRWGKLGQGWTVELSRALMGHPDTARILTEAGGLRPGHLNTIKQRGVGPCITPEPFTREGAEQRLIAVRAKRALAHPDPSVCGPAVDVVLADAAQMATWSGDELLAALANRAVPAERRRALHTQVRMMELPALEAAQPHQVSAHGDPDTLEVWASAAPLTALTAFGPGIWRDPRNRAVAIQELARVQWHLQSVLPKLEAQDMLCLPAEHALRFADESAFTSWLAGVLPERDGAWESFYALLSASHGTVADTLEMLEAIDA